MSTSYAPTKIEVFRPAIGQAEIDAAQAVLRSGWIGRGPKVAELERAWAERIGVAPEHVISLSCATEALFQVMAWIGRRHPGGAVVMPANSYIGTANAAGAAGLGVLLCDIDRGTLNPTLAHLRAALTTDTVAVAIQHYGGVPSDQEWIEAICQEREIYLIEDCACAPASMFQGMPSGVDCDFGIWSLDAMKVITGADGGLLYCRDATAAAEIRRATLLGQDVASGKAGGAERWWEFKVEGEGRRSVMNDLQAAIVLVQLGRLNDLVAARQALWTSYRYGLLHLPWLAVAPDLEPGVRSSYYTFWVQLERRDELAVFLRARGVYTTYRYWPVHRAYGWQERFGWRSRWPAADWAADHTLNLPLHPGLTAADVAFICDSIAEFGRNR